MTTHLRLVLNETEVNNLLRLFSYIRESEKEVDELIAISHQVLLGRRKNLIHLVDSLEQIQVCALLMKELEEKIKASNV